MTSIQAQAHAFSRAAPPGHAPQVEVSALAGSPIACGSVVYRHRGQLYVTAVVKATFALVPDGVAAVVSPEAIRAEEEHHGDHPASSLRSADDLAPRRPRVDVVFVGHAHAGAREARSTSARLAVFGERALVDKTIHVYGDWSAPAGGGAQEGTALPFDRMPIVYERAYASRGDRSCVANPVGTPRPNLVDPRDPRRPIGFGPIPRAWPIRAHLLSDADRGALGAPVPDFSLTFDWRYFQVAPPDQQVDALRGDEWIVLDGLHPARSRLQVRLPSAAPIARVHRRAGSDAGAPLSLVLDTLAIDGDRERCSLVWRGSVPVPEGEAGLPSLQILVALKLPGRGSGKDLAAGTAYLSPVEQIRANGAPATPFDGAAPVRMVGPRSPSPDIPGAPWASSPPPANTQQPAEETADEPLPLGATVGVGAMSPFVAPFALAAPGASRPSSAELPGAPWAATPAAHAPEIDGSADGTMLIQAPEAMLALLGGPSKPAPERRVERPPALPLKGGFYGKPRRRSR